MHDATARGQVLPSVVLTLLSFIAFFMNPDTGERLGSGPPWTLKPLGRHSLYFISLVITHITCTERRLDGVNGQRRQVRHHDDPRHARE